LTTYWAPAAAGSGIAELIGYLNGVNYPGFIGIPTLITKILGVSFAVSGKLCVGKEGPLAHIGANIGLLTLYMPFFNFDFLKNDEVKRQFAAAGASAGVSVAFGSPIGGALFCYELSRPNTFWKFEMIWKVFFCCCVGTFSLAFFNSFVKEDEGVDDKTFSWSGTALKFGSLESTKVPKIAEILPGAIVLGVIGGVLGAFFINVNTYVNGLRKKYITKPWMKIAECAFFCVATTSLFYWATYNFGSCVKREMEVNEEE